MATRKSTHTAPDLSVTACSESRSTLDFIDETAMSLDHARAVLILLAQGFEARLISTKLFETSDFMGSVQYVAGTLAQLHKRIMGETADLPDDLRWRTFEAASAVGLLDSLLADEGYAFEQQTEEVMAATMGMALECVEKARTAVRTMEVSHG